MLRKREKNGVNASVKTRVGVHDHKVVLKAEMQVKNVRVQRQQQK